jgi:hypothetical protein
MESVWEISDDLRRRAEMWRRYFRDEGWLMGWAERFVEGQTDSYAESLFLLLEERFGLVPWTLREQIRDAKLAVLKRWFKLAITAPDLYSVFDRK